jgi:hypothetical protein
VLAKTTLLCDNIKKCKINYHWDTNDQVERTREKDNSKLPPDNMVQNPRRQSSSYSPPQESEISHGTHFYQQLVNIILRQIPKFLSLLYTQLIHLF